MIRAPTPRPRPNSVSRALTGPHDSVVEVAVATSAWSLISLRTTFSMVIP